MLALAWGAVLVTYAAMDGDVRKIVSYSIYGFTLFLLYLVSTLYHSLRGPAKRVFRVLDHRAIYLLSPGHTPRSRWSHSMAHRAGGVGNCPGCTTVQGTQSGTNRNLPRHGLAMPVRAGLDGRRPAATGLSLAAGG